MKAIKPGREQAGNRPESGGPRGRRLPPLLRRAWFSLNQAFRRRIAHLGLTPDQYTALRTLSERGAESLNQRALTALMSSDPNTIASLLERMELAGWVHRTLDASDRRARRVRATPAGTALFAEAQDIALALQAEVLRGVPGRERDQFLARLEQVAEACRDAADPAARAAPSTAVQRTSSPRSGRAPAGPRWHPDGRGPGSTTAGTPRGRPRAAR